MTYQHYSPDFKAKIVLDVLQGEKGLGEIAKEHSINPNLIRKWRAAFLEKASMVFEDAEKEMAEAKRKEERLEKKQRQMLSTIGQLTLERDFLQNAFRRTGRPVPKFDPEDEMNAEYRVNEEGISRHSIDARTAQGGKYGYSQTKTEKPTLISEKRREAC